MVKNLAISHQPSTVSHQPQLESCSILHKRNLKPSAMAQKLIADTKTFSLAIAMLGERGAGVEPLAGGTPPL